MKALQSLKRLDTRAPVVILPCRRARRELRTSPKPSLMSQSAWEMRAQ